MTNYFLIGFDSNDELVFMARHLGDQYDNVGAYPPDILPVIILINFVITLSK